MKRAIYSTRTLQATGTCSPAVRCGIGLFNRDGRDAAAVRLVDAHMNLA